MSWQTANSLHDLPNNKGIYAIYSQDIPTEPLYIGAAKRIQTRLMTRNVYDKFNIICLIYGIENLFYKYKKTDELYLEKLLIFRLQPKFNHNQKKSKKLCL